MGGKQSVFEEEDLVELQELTYLTKYEILKAYSKFVDLKTHEKHVAGKNPKRPIQGVLEMKELKTNPFRHRMCKVFSVKEQNYMYFEEYLEMLSVFSEGAPIELKATYAFRIYDFNDDHQIDKEDLHELVSLLTNNELDSRDERDLLEKVLKETDFDEDGCLSLAEFQYILSKAPDFSTSFRILL